MDSLGSKLYEYRKIRGMSRKELSEGICDISTLYRIENGLHHPHIHTLKLLCQRLRIPMNRLLTLIEQEEIQYIYNKKQQCRQLVYEEKFDELAQLIHEIEMENKKRELIDFDFDLFLQWHKAIISHELKGDIQQAKVELEKLCPKSGVYVTETEIGIANSLGYIFLDLDKFDQAMEIYQSIMKTYEKMPFIEDKLLYVRTVYNFIYSLYKNHQFEKVIDYSLKLLHFLETNHLKIMHAEINHMLGVVYERLNQLPKAIIHMEKATFLFFINDKKYYYLKSLRALAEYQLKNGDHEKGKTSLYYVKEKITELEDPQNLSQLITETEQKYMVNQH